MKQAKLATAAQATGQPLDQLKGSYNELYAITTDETMSSTAVANMSAMGMSAENQQRQLTQQQELGRNLVIQFRSMD